MAVVAEAVIVQLVQQGVAELAAEARVLIVTQLLERRGNRIPEAVAEVFGITARHTPLEQAAPVLSLSDIQTYTQI